MLFSTAKIRFLTFGCSDMCVCVCVLIGVCFTVFAMISSILCGIMKYDDSFISEVLQDKR